MNIFYLHESPLISAQAMTNKHVVKMILETAQLLSTAHHVLDSDLSPFKDDLYKMTHKNHPSSIWVRESHHNYMWAYSHFKALCKEYTKRYGKVHATQKKLDTILSHFPINIPHTKGTPIRLAITNKDFHLGNAVESYRTYYEHEKLHTDIDTQRYHAVLGV